MTTDTLSVSMTSDQGTSVAGRITATGSTRASISNNYPAATVNQNVAITIPFATLRSLKISSDKNCTVAFNSSGTPVPLITIVGGSPYVWESSSGYFPNPLTVNITQVFISCTSAINFFLEALSG